MNLLRLVLCVISFDAALIQLVFFNSKITGVTLTLWLSAILMAFFRVKK